MASKSESGILRPQLQPGAEQHLRQPLKPGTPNIEQEPLKYIALALVHLRNELAKLPNMIEDQSKPVDEYNNQTIQPEGISTIELQAQYETPERIESVLIVGPAAATVTLQLGDRFWPLIIPATGFLLIGAPLGIFLNRADLRILTASTPGNYFIELMGHADTRGNLI